MRVFFFFLGGGGNGSQDYLAQQRPPGPSAANGTAVLARTRPSTGGPAALARGMEAPTRETEDDSMYLYEVAGLLVSLDTVSNADRAEYLRVRASDLASGNVGLFLCAR